jgi:hypothetical protein
MPSDPILTPAQWEHALLLTLSGDPFERRGALSALRAHEEAWRERLAEAETQRRRSRAYGPKVSTRRGRDE